MQFILPFLFRLVASGLRIFRDFAGSCKGKRAIDLFAESGKGIIICWFQVRTLAGPPQAVPMFRVVQKGSGGLRCE